MAFVEKMKNWAARSLIRTKRIKQVCYNADELNELISEALPHKEYFEVPGGQAQLVVMDAQAGIGKDNAEGMSMTLLCSIEIRSLKLQLYRAHLNVKLKIMPYYVKQDEAIRFHQAELFELQFINDEYVLVKNSSDIIRALTPNILKGIVNVTLGSTMAVLGDVASPQVKEYLGIFSDSNKQKVLEFHQGQIAKLVTELVESPEMAYPLDKNDFEEKLFADLGQRIDVEDHQLVFKF